jgi:hypothetical protein
VTVLAEQNLLVTDGDAVQSTMIDVPTCEQDVACELVKQETVVCVAVFAEQNLVVTEGDAVQPTTSDIPTCEQDVVFESVKQSMVVCVAVLLLQVELEVVELEGASV